MKTSPLLIIAASVVVIGSGLFLVFSFLTTPPTLPMAVVSNPQAG